MRRAVEPSPVPAAPRRPCGAPGFAAALLLAAGLAAPAAGRQPPDPAIAPARAAPAQADAAQDAPAQGVPAQAAPRLDPAPQDASRWEGWHAVRDASWRFDPDDRPMLGFAVRASPGARAELDAALAALDAGDPSRAAPGLVALAAGRGDDALQVAASPPRWVGAAEYALYLLATRVPAPVLESLAGRDTAALLETATAWRDRSTLRDLATRFEGLPEGRRAAASLARLLEERGAREAAALAVRRASPLAAPATAPAPDADPALDAQAFADGAPLRPLWSAPLTIARLAGRYNPFAQWPGREDAPVAPVAPRVAGGVVYLADSISTSALELHSGRVIWHHAGPLEITAQEGLLSAWFGLDTYVGGMRERAVSPYQCAEPALGERVVVAAEQAREPRRKLHDFEGIPINWPLPVRHLVALDRETGRELWRQRAAPGDGDPFLDSLSIAGPAALGGGMAVAAGSLTQGAISSYAVAFDLESGDLLWRTLLCAGQQDLTMFNRPFSEHTASPALLAGGAVYACTNLGAVASLDAWSGRLRWLAGYDALERHASKSPGQDRRRRVPWTNRPPQLHGGTLVVTPLDSPQLLALEASTGRLLYALDADALAPLAVRQDALLDGSGRLIVVGPSLVEAFRASTGQPLWQHRLELQGDSIVGPATLAAGGKLLVPTFTRLLVVDLESPQSPARELAWDRARLPNGARRVVPAGAALVLAAEGSLHGVIDVGRALEERGTASPAGRFASAELLLASGRPDEAAARFDELLAGEESPFHARARAGRLQIALEAARSAREPGAWDELLGMAERFGGLLAIAPEALAALAELGASEALDRWIGALAAADPQARVSAGALTPEGPQPVALLAARRAAEREALAAARDGARRAVAALQELIERWPDERWDGRPVRERAAERIAELLRTHGRQAYEPFEARAREILERAAEAAAGARGDLAASAGKGLDEALEALGRESYVTGLIEAMEALYPNALALGEAFAAHVEALLARGDPAAALESLAARGDRLAADALAALRLRAARALGEAAFAERLERAGASPSAGPSLPALPAGTLRLSVHEVVERGALGLPVVGGRPAVRWASCALGLAREEGLLVLVDGAGDRLAWRRAWPGDEDLEWHHAGDALVVQRAREGDDLLEALALEDGRTLWSRSVPGVGRGLAEADGLVLRLCELIVSGQRRLRVEGFGRASGALALRIELPAVVSARLEVAGGHALVTTVRDRLRDGTPVDARLLALDLVAGAIGAELALEGAAPTLLATLDEPPGVLLGIAARGGGPASLELRDAATLERRWRSEVSAAQARGQVYADGEGGLLLASLEPGTGGAARLSRIDPRTGGLDAVPMPVVARPASGQSGGGVAWLVLRDDGDPRRLHLAGVGAPGAGLSEILLPSPPRGAPRIAPAADGFAMLVDPVFRGEPAVLRLFEGATGAERYSADLTGLAAPGRSELSVTEGTVIVVNAGKLFLLRGTGAR